MSNYQNTIDKARGFDQLQSAMRQGHASTPRMSSPFSESYHAVVRAKVASSVYSIWEETRQAASLGQIFYKVVRNIEHDPEWPKHWTIPSKRTTDRRANEAADMRFYQGTTPIVSVRAGVYCPNPRRFEGKARTLLEALSHSSNI